MNALEQDIQDLIRKPIDPEDLSELSRVYVGAMKCLMILQAEAKDEGGNINQGINQRARGRTQPSGAKYTPFRLCKA